MRVFKLEAENFKNLKAVEITPDGNMVVVGGKNEQGKSSVMDAIWVAIKGRSVAPPKPIRNGEEECHIKLDLGELRISRKFKATEKGTYTDSVKVENDSGLRYSKPQEVLDALLGELGFDPLDFVRMKPKDQAETLLQMVPLSVDLEELEEQDASDFANRRDVNRDGVSVKAQLDAIPKEDVPKEAPDREALQAQLAGAAETNSAIERDRMTRERTRATIDALFGQRDELRARAEELRQQAADADAKADQINADATESEEAFKALPALAEPVDVTAIQTQLREAESVLNAIERQRRRGDLEKQLEDLRAKSQGFTDAMAARAETRNKALAEAKMPIDGLGFEIGENGKPIVVYNGVPFEQASTAQQIRASAKIGMEANPQLRILRIKDGSLLDEESMAMLRDMAVEDDFQLWVEVVGTGGVGIIMEAGEVKAEPGAAKKAKAEPEAEAEPEGPVKCANPICDETVTDGGGLCISCEQDEADSLDPDRQREDQQEKAALAAEQPDADEPAAEGPLL